MTTQKLQQFYFSINIVSLR